MTRLLQLSNLLGILLLVGLCGVQWNQDRQLHQQLFAAEQASRQQADTITRQQQTIHDQLADLDDFRARLATADTATKETTAKLNSAASERTLLISQRDQLQAAYNTLKASLEKWTAAVASRDAALQKAKALAGQLAADRNDTVTKYNALAAQYNAAVAEIKKAGETVQSLATQRNDAVAKFNDLAVKYNALVANDSKPATTPR